MLKSFSLLFSTHLLPLLLSNTHANAQSNIENPLPTVCSIFPPFFFVFFFASLCFVHIYILALKTPKWTSPKKNTKPDSKCKSQGSLPLIFFCYTPYFQFFQFRFPLFRLFPFKKKKKRVVSYLSCLNLSPVSFFFVSLLPRPLSRTALFQDAREPENRAS